MTNKDFEYYQSEFERLRNNPIPMPIDTRDDIKEIFEILSPLYDHHSSINTKLAMLTNTIARLICMECFDPSDGFIEEISMGIYTAVKNNISLHADYMKERINEYLDKKNQEKSE